MAATEGALAGLRRPEYTGENRCMPCTIVNSLIAILGSLVLGAVVWAVATPLIGLAGGIAFLGLAAASIYLRGYLVPGTPTLTKRYLPTRVLEWFDKAPEAQSVPEGEAVDAESVLVNLGALEECADRPDLCLTPEFRSAWQNAMDAVETGGEGRDRLLDLLDIDGQEVSFESYGGAFRALIDGMRVGTWESEAAFRADLGAATLLEERDSSWADRPVHDRGRLLNGLRLFLEQCPACGGQPSFGTETVESCCSTHEVAAVECEDCGARLFETRAPS